MSQVRNFGPSVVDGSKVTITVPKLLRKSDPESYLIYLLQVEVRNFSKFVGRKIAEERVFGVAVTGRRGEGGCMLASELRASVLSQASLEFLSKLPFF